MSFSTSLPLVQEDNGVKLIDPMGEMLTPAWEVYATQLANAEQDHLITVLKDLVQKESIDLTNQEAEVFVGRDTRYGAGLVFSTTGLTFMLYICSSYDYICYRGISGGQICCYFDFSADCY